MATLWDRWMGLTATFYVVFLWLLIQGKKKINMLMLQIYHSLTYLLIFIDRNDNNNSAESIDC